MTWRIVLLFALIGWLTPRAQSSEVTLEWDANTEPDVAGYNIYIGTQSRQYDVFLDAGSNTIKRVQSLEPGRTYYFAVTAFNRSLLESAFSDEVTYTVPVNGTNAFLPPLSITRLGTLPSIDFPVQSGRIYVVQASTDLHSWETIHTVSGSANETIRWIDNDAANHQKRFYRIIASGL